MGAMAGLRELCVLLLCFTFFGLSEGRPSSGRRLNNSDNITDITDAAGGLPGSEGSSLSGGVVSLASAMQSPLAQIVSVPEAVMSPPSLAALSKPYVETQPITLGVTIDSGARVKISPATTRVKVSPMSARIILRPSNRLEPLAKPSEPTTTTTTQFEPLNTSNDTTTEPDIEEVNATDSETNATDIEEEISTTITPPTETSSGVDVGLVLGIVIAVLCVGCFPVASYCSFKRQQARRRRQHSQVFAKVVPENSANDGANADATSSQHQMGSAWQKCLVAIERCILCSCCKSSDKIFPQESSKSSSNSQVIQVRPSSREEVMDFGGSGRYAAEEVIDLGAGEGSSAVGGGEDFKELSQKDHQSLKVEQVEESPEFFEDGIGLYMSNARAALGFGAGVGLADDEVVDKRAALGLGVGLGLVDPEAEDEDESQESSRQSKEKWLTVTELEVLQQPSEGSKSSVAPSSGEPSSGQPSSSAWAASSSDQVDRRELWRWDLKPKEEPKCAPPEESTKEEVQQLPGSGRASKGKAHDIPPSSLPPRNSSATSKSPPATPPQTRTLHRAPSEVGPTPKPAFERQISPKSKPILPPLDANRPSTKESGRSTPSSTGSLGNGRQNFVHATPKAASGASPVFAHLQQRILTSSVPPGASLISPSLSSSSLRPQGAMPQGPNPSTERYRGMKCAKCQNVLAHDSNFCRMCGHQRGCPVNGRTQETDPFNETLS
mmetsp:Transcript_27477/g.50479  ORF Transcript_27477/g.50479 Transcript_27477/m.50479 type:complete len:722 (+) Transcript_27477:46-2211(+)